MLTGALLGSPAPAGLTTTAAAATAPLLERRYWMEKPGDAARDVPGAIAQLMKLLKDGDVAVRIAAARQLGELGCSAEAALPALIEALSDRDEHTLYVFWDDRATTPVRLAVAEALAKINPAGLEAAIPVLIELLGHRDAYDPNYKSTRSAAEGLLTTIGVPAAPALRKALRSRNPEIRALARRALMRIHSGRQEDAEGTA
jgi:HEAT repeat protein